MEILFSHDVIKRMTCLKNGFFQERPKPFTTFTDHEGLFRYENLRLT